MKVAGGSMSRRSTPIIRITCSEIDKGGLYVRVCKYVSHGLSERKGGMAFS
jgi:hypothetical protein